MADETYLLTLPQSAHYPSVLSSIRMYPQLDEVTEVAKAPLLDIYALNLPEDTPFETVQSINDLDFVLSFERSRDVVDLRIAFPTPERVKVTPQYVNRFESKLLAPYEDLEIDIAVVDSGLDTRNPNLNEVKERHNYTTDSTLDWSGHGTVVALIRQYALPSASFYDMKVSSEEMLTETNVICAINDAVAEGVDLINISLGFETRYKSDACPLCEAVNRAVDTGVAVWASAGNHASENNPMTGPICPACSDGALAMGSQGPDGERKVYSALSDVYAPDDWLFEDTGLTEE